MDLYYSKHSLTLNGNELTGNTFPAKEFIKSKLAGKWNPERKSWTVNLDEVNYWIAKSVLVVRPAAQPQPEAHPHTHANNGLCPRCHTYCYGDCTAH